MIESIKIKNFQSHKASQLKFHPQVNTIVGSSDSGKTAVMRALFWVIQNRPLGTAFFSHWATDKKGEQIEPTWANVIINGVKIRRTRYKENNSYMVGAKSLEAMGKAVPEEIIQTFNLTEVNIQRQMDSPFLLSESAGEVARFFNRIIRLDIIDSFLSAAESKKRQAKVKKGEFESKIVELIYFLFLERFFINFQYIPTIITIFI